VNAAARRVTPLVLVAAAHAALAWGLWHPAIEWPGAGAQPLGLRWVVPARLVAEPAPPPPPAARTPSAQRPAVLGPMAARAVVPEVMETPEAPAPAAPAGPAAAAWAPPPPDTPAPLAMATGPAAEPPAPATPATRERVPPDNSPCGRAPYPLLLQERGIEGTLRLRVHVAADGRATQVQLLTSSGFRLFDEAALAQARGCRFRPARWGEQAVDEWVEYPVRFSLQG